MLGIVQHRLAQPGVIAEAQRRHDRDRWRRPEQAFALERRPYRRVTQTGCVPRGYNCLADVEVIAVWIGQAGQNDAARIFTRSRLVGQPRQLLKQGQRPQLQRIQTERVSLGCHSL